VEASTAASDSPTAAVSHTTGVNRDKELTTTKPKEPLPPGRTLQVASEVRPEVEVEAVEANALVRYTIASASRPDSFRTPGASIPREIRRSFTLLARYYTSPSTQASPTPITTSLLAFLDNFITNRITPTSFHTVTVQNLSAIEDRLLVDTIRWVRYEGITFPAPRPSIHPVHQAQGLSIQPVHQAQRLSIQGPSVHPVHQAQGLTIQPVHQAQRLSTQVPSVQPVHQDQELSIQPAQHVRYIDRPTRPAEACLDRCEQMRAREASSGAGGQWPPATSRPGDI